MTNSSTQLVVHPVNVAFPEKASRAQWTEIAKRLRGIGLSAGIVASSDKHAAFTALASASYALLISSSLDGDDSILVNFRKYLATLPDSIGKDGNFKKVYADKVNVLIAANNAAISQRKEFAGQAEIAAIDMLASIVLHGELSAMAPKAAVAKVAAPKAATGAPKAKVAEVAPLSDAAIATSLSTLNPSLDNKAVDTAEIYQFNAPERAKALAELKAQQSVDADNLAREIALATAAKIAAMEAENETVECKAIALCRLCDFFGIKLDKRQLAKIEAVEKMQHAA